MAVRKRAWVTRAGETRTSFIAEYALANGRKHLKTFPTKKEATDYYARVMAEKVAGIHVPPSTSATIAEAAAAWLARTEERSTRRTYESLYRIHIANHLGKVRLSELTGGMVARLDDALLNCGASLSTRRKVHTALFGIVAVAKARGLVVRNAVSDYEVPRGARAKKKKKLGDTVPTQRDVNLFTQVLDVEWRAFFMLMAYAGLRPSEARAIRWENIDLDRRVIHVVERADETGAVGNPKSGSAHRTVDICSQLNEALTAHRGGAERSGLVFKTSTGTPYDLANIRSRVMMPAMRKAGLLSPAGGLRYSPHSFRHFFASWCAGRRESGGLGMEMADVQALMGHASLSQTSDTYAHFWPGAGGKLRAA